MNKNSNVQEQRKL